MPNTHRRRRRDATVELSRIGVGGVNTIRNYSSRRLPADAFTPLTRRNSTRCSQTCSELSKLSPISCEFRIHNADATQLSTVASRRRRRCGLESVNGTCVAEICCVSPGSVNHLYTCISYYSILELSSHACNCQANSSCAFYV